jgi:hypothetical protein
MAVCSALDVFLLPQPKPPLDVSVLHQPLLLWTCLFYSKLCWLDVSVLQVAFGHACPTISVLPLDLSVLQQPVIPLAVPVLQQPELPLDVSVLQQPLLPFDVSVLQLFLFNSCCRTDVSGEDLSINSINLCKETRTRAAKASIEQTRPVGAQAAVEHIRSETAPTTIYLIDSRMLTFSVFSLVRVTRSTRATVIQNTEA